MKPEVKQFLIFTGLFFLTLFATAYLLIWKAGFAYRLPGYHAVFYTSSAYEKKCLKINEKRIMLHQTLLKSDSLEQKRVLFHAETILNRFISEEIFPFWYGTKYGFHGTTQIPGRGQIACGYFVTTVLEDVGVELNRVELARAPSEKMIRALVEAEFVWRFSKYTIEDFLTAVKSKGEGLFIVGLDTHTGFIMVKDNDVRFIHASGRSPLCVINEPAITSTSLIKSKYRVIGKLSYEFSRKWLENQ